MICEDAWQLRAGLVALFSRAADITVVAQLQSTDKMTPVVIMSRPDVAVIDIDMPGAPEALTLLRDVLPTCRTLVLFNRDNRGHFLHPATGLAQGLMLKTASSDLILTAVRRVASGERVIDPILARRASCAAANPLTPREIIVLRVAAEGVSAPEIAKRLNLSPGTVRNYISQAITKTGTRNRLDAIRIARKQGWLLPAEAQKH